jgi:hypothetical protein
VLAFPPYHRWKLTAAPNGLTLHALNHAGHPSGGQLFGANVIWNGIPCEILIVIDFKADRS